MILLTLNNRNASFAYERKNINAMKKKLLCIVIIIITCINIVLPVSAAESEWTMMSKAKEFETAGKYAEAYAYWVKLVDYFSSTATAGQLENGGHYATKAGDYNAGKYVSSTLNAGLAVRYYEKAKDFYTRAMALSGKNFEWAVVASDRKAAQYRVVVRLYMEKTFTYCTLTRPLAKHEPENGMILGIYAERDPVFRNDVGLDLDKLKQYTGRDHTAQLLYAAWGSSSFPTTFAQRVKDRGGALQISMQPSGGLDTVRDGEYIRNWARAAKASGIPVFLRFGGEMNGSWTAWDGSPQLYIEKYRLIHDILAVDAPNVAMVWAPNDYPWNNYSEFYPGDKYVDWVGVSTYMMLSYTSDTKDETINADPMYKLSHIIKQYGLRKPIMIVETGSSYTSVTEHGLDFTDWAINNMNKYYSYLPRFYPQIKGIFYYSFNANTGSYMLSQNSRILQNYKEQIQSAYYLEHISKPAPLYYHEIKNGESVSGLTRLSAYIDIYEPVISRVVYELKNIATGTVTSLGQVTKIPYEMNADFSKLPFGAYDIIVKAYDSKGREAHVQTFRVNNINDKPSSWAQEAVDKARSAGLLPLAFQSGYSQATTRAEFAALAVALYEKVAGQITGRTSFNDTSDVNVQKAAYAGIVSGVGDNRFDPNGKLTREQAAVILDRLAGILGRPLPQKAPTFNDNAKIAGWAFAPVGHVQAGGVMGGVGDNMFAPKDVYKREQCVVTVMRLYEMLMSG